MWNSGTYRRARARLIAEMGGRCVYCRTADNLQFGHKRKHKTRLETINRMSRLRLYRKEWERGKMELECKHCNCSHRNGDKPGWVKFCEAVGISALTDIRAAPPQLRAPL